MTRESAIVAIGLVSATVAIGAAIASLLDLDAFRRFADGVAPDGNVEILGRATNAQLLAALRALAVVAAIVAATLLTLRRSAAHFLAGPPVPSANADNAKASTFELAVAGLVVVVGIALAGRNLAATVRVDEANTVLRFASQSPWTVLSDYSSPNNHLLHTLLVYVAHQLGGWEVAALRVPAFLAATLVLPAVWLFVRREHGRFAASLAAALVATSPLFLEYAANARGHMLMTLFFLLSLLCAQRLLHQPDAKWTWPLFSLCIALGFFTVPFMAYPTAVTVAWMLVVRWRQAGAAAMPPFAARTALWLGAALALALVLYAPVLVVSGWGSVFDSRHIQEAQVSWLDGRRLLQLAWNLSAAAWGNWHAAAPIWAQAALAMMVAVGAAAVRRPTGHRGTFPLAVVLGLAAALAVKPVLLPTRFTIFLFCALMMVAGAGGALLIDAVLTRLRMSVGLRSATRGLALLAVLACFGWWATRPGVAEQFRGETGWSPAAPTLAAGVAHDLRPGDVLASQEPLFSGMRFYLKAAGLPLTQIHKRKKHGADSCASALPSDAGLRRMKPACGWEVLACLPESGKPWWVMRIDGRHGQSNASGALGRLFLFVEEVAYGPAKGRRHPVASSRTMRPHIEQRGYDHQVIDLSVGKAYRLAPARWGECRPGAL